MNSSVVTAINTDMQLQLNPVINEAELTAALVVHINHLINTNFEKLVNILYRIDVNENKLKELLSRHNEENAATIIAKAVIQRQLQKIKSREQYGTAANNSGEEKW
jgi:hypothetical protein